MGNKSIRGILRFSYFLDADPRAHLFLSRIPLAYTRTHPFYTRTLPLKYSLNIYYPTQFTYQKPPRQFNTVCLLPPTISSSSPPHAFHLHLHFRLYFAATKPRLPSENLFTHPLKHWFPLPMNMPLARNTLLLQVIDAIAENTKMETPKPDVPKPKGIKSQKFPSISKT